MQIFKKSISVCAALLISTAALQGQTSGTIAGIVTDEGTELPVAGAAVTISGTTRGAASDAEGRFSISGLQPGEYDVDVEMLSYSTRRIENVTVKRGETTHLAVALAQASEMVGEVVVTAVRRVGTESAINAEIRNSRQVVSGVSRRTIARTQDRNAGEAMRRIPGISIMDDKFVIARGLSQRYNNVWIDNAAVPSSEADTRAFSFDMIPAGNIEYIMILKSPAPELPADFSGGFVKIGTRDIPDEGTISVGLSAGINTSTHFGDFLFNPGPAGLGSRARMWAGGIRGAYDNGNAGFVDRMTRTGFGNDWSVRRRPAIPDHNLTLSGGQSWALSGGNRLALTCAVNYGRTERTIIDMGNSRYGIYNKREDKPEYLYKYVDDQYRSDVRLGAMLNIVLLRPGGRFCFRNLFNMLGSDRYTFREGWQNISSLYIQEKSEYLHSTRCIYNGQFAGVHDIGSGRLEWTAGYSYADRHQPDRRIIDRQENDLHGDPGYGHMQIDQNAIRRDFTQLTEHMVSAGADYSTPLGEGKRFSPTFRAGIRGDFRTREYIARAFFYRFDASNLPADFVYGDPVGDILVPDNFGHDRLYIYDDTDNRNSYEGDAMTAAAYAGIDMPLGRLEIHAGVRYEHDLMTLTSYTRATEWTSRKRSYAGGDFFPSLNSVFHLNDRHQLRAAYGMSTNRPEFREVSASAYYDFDLFATIMGNPDLKSALIHNAEVRYEWYPSAEENISLAVFYKHFINPIETTIRDAGGSYTYTYENAARARAYGIELDIRKRIARTAHGEFSVSLNAVLIGSRVFFDGQSLEHDRPMQGQSPYIINGGVFYSSERLGLNIGLLYNRIGKRIVGIGRRESASGGSIDNDIPDMYEMPRNSLDLAVAKSIGKHWEVRFSAKDLICDRVEMCQFPEFTGTDGQTHIRKEVTRSYWPGRSFSIGVTAKF